MANPSFFHDTIPGTQSGVTKESNPSYLPSELYPPFPSWYLVGPTFEYIWYFYKS